MKNTSIYVPSQALFLSRRRAMSVSGAAVLSASAVALLGGRDALAAGAKVSAKDLESDVRILNSALGAEFEAITRPRSPLRWKRWVERPWSPRPNTSFR